MSCKKCGSGAIMGPTYTPPMEVCGNLASECLAYRCLVCGYTTHRLCNDAMSMERKDEGEKAYREMIEGIDRPVRKKAVDALDKYAEKILATPSKPLNAEVQRSLCYMAYVYLDLMWAD